MKKYADGGSLGGIGSLPPDLRAALKRRKMGAGAGRGFVNPKLVNESDEDYVTPGQRYEMEKDLRDRRESEAAEKAYNAALGMKKGGSVSASRRADGIAQRGKTRGKMI